LERLLPQSGAFLALTGQGAGLLNAGICSISAGVTALTLALVVKSVAVYAPGHIENGAQKQRLNLSIIDARYFDNAAYRNTIGLQTPDSSVSFTAIQKSDVAPADLPEEPYSTVAERFSFDVPSDSFGDRFGGAPLRLASLGPTDMGLYSSQDGAVAVLRQQGSPPPDSSMTGSEKTGAGGASSALRSPRLSASASPNSATRGGNARQASLSSLPDNQNRTAIYDISSQMVYLPDGRRLEAHSGLGSFMDDPHYVGVKNQGPTPPNTYRLALRENLFHGVRALRLIPVGDGNMFGRDGILAHHYLLGPNGASNGCVSFANYSEFLNAYLNGDIDRLVVVERLANPPSSMVASNWFDRAIKSFTRVFDRGSGT
jgi:hypothetical protein